MVAITRRSTWIGAGVAETIELALLQRAQQFGLQPERHLAHFVEQQRAAVGQFEFARLRIGRAGEGALGMAEQLAFEQSSREMRRS